MAILYGIDLGGTKIEGVVLKQSDAAHDSRDVLARLRLPTEQEGGYTHILQQIARVVELLEKETGTKATRLGIGTPGTSDPISGLHKNSNTTCLNGKPTHADLEKLLKIPVALANDANCFAIAEANLGVVRDVLPSAQVVFGVIMGSGVGGGLVFNGRVWNGRQGIGGEWGHNFLHESGRKCYCGQVGCVETLISGPALERFYKEQSGKALKLKDILAQTTTDPHAQATLNRLITYFGKSMATIINILDPDAIVLGGGVGNVPELYTQGRAEVAKYIFNPQLDTLFLKPKLGDSAGVFGAALL
jgi:fructokinase